MKNKNTKKKNSRQGYFLIFYWTVESDLLHGGNIDGLDFIFPGGDEFDDIIRGDLIILDDTSDLQLLHSEGDFDLLPFFSPLQSVQLDVLEDLLGKGIKILFDLEDLDIEDDGGLGWSLWSLVLLVLLSDSLESLLVSLFSFFILISEQIEFIISSRLFLLLLLLFSSLSLGSTSP